MHRYFGFAIETLQILQHPENVKISIFPLHCPSRNAITSKVFNEFSNKFFLDERWGRWLLWLKISSAQSFWFCNSNVTTFPTSRKWKISIFHVHCPSRNAISSKVFNEFSKNFFSLEEEEGYYCAWKFQVHRYFDFAVAKFQHFQHPEYVKISIFPFPLSRQKCYKFKSI